MPFEITIEGPFADISQLNSSLASFSPLIKKIPGLNENRERGRITILESREGSWEVVHEKYSFISLSTPK